MGNCTSSKPAAKGQPGSANVPPQALRRNDPTKQPPSTPRQEPAAQLEMRDEIKVPNSARNSTTRQDIIAKDGFSAAQAEIDAPTISNNIVAKDFKIKKQPSAISTLNREERYKQTLNVFELLRVDDDQAILKLAAEYDNELNFIQNFSDAVTFKYDDEEQSMPDWQLL